MKKTPCLDFYATHSQVAPIVLWPDCPARSYEGPSMGGDNRVSKNAFINSNGQVNRCTDDASCHTQTMVDRVAQLSAEHYGGEDICMWTYQALAPPTTAGVDASVNADGSFKLTPNGHPTMDLGQPFYQYPMEDMRRLVDLCDMAANRLQSHVQNYSENGGAVPLAQ